MTPNRKSAKEFVDNYKFDFESSEYEYLYSESEVYKLVEEYGKQQWNEAIKLAAEKAEITGEFFGYEYSVNKQSILKLLKP